MAFPVSLPCPVEALLTLRKADLLLVVSVSSGGCGACVSLRGPCSMAAQSQTAVVLCTPRTGEAVPGVGPVPAWREPRAAVQAPLYLWGFPIMTAVPAHLPGAKAGRMTVHCP